MGTLDEEDAVYYCIDLADVVQKSYEIVIDQDTKQETKWVIFHFFLILMNQDNLPFI